MAEAEIAIDRIAPETSFKNKAYDALKEAILKMDIYATPEPVMLDEPDPVEQPQCLLVAGDDHSAIARVVLVEMENAKISQKSVTEAALSAIAPAAVLQVVRTTMAV